MKGMKRRIDTTKELRQMAMKVFKVTEQTVYNAIGFDKRRGDTEKAKRIRSYILQNGGEMLVELKEVETIHDADGYMRQYFPNGAMIEVDKRTGNLKGYYRGEEVMDFKDVKLRQLDDIQRVMSVWSNKKFV
nr:MAG TPA: hypothetical protein [Caudoviricetes sp.]